MQINFKKPTKFDHIFRTYKQVLPRHSVQTGAFEAHVFANQTENNALQWSIREATKACTKVSTDSRVRYFLILLKLRRW